MNGSNPREVSKNLIIEILSARAEELFHLVSEIIKERSVEQLVNGGYILTGGGSLIKDMTTLGEYILLSPCKVGYPESFWWNDQYHA